MKALKLLTAYLLGIFIIPFLLIGLPKDATELRLLNWCFGNHKGLSTDGIAPVARWCPRYWWLAIRNPANALGISYGLNGILTGIQKNKPNNHELGSYIAYATAVGTDGVTRHGEFYYGVYKYPFIDRYFRYAFGSKIWGSYKVGDTIDSGYAVSVLPFINKGTAGL